MASKGLNNDNSEEQISKEFPFLNKPDPKPLGSGWESAPRKLGEKLVINEVNRFTSDGQERSQEMIEMLRSPERVKKMVNEQNRLENIINKENFAKTSFVYGKYREDEDPIYMPIHEYIPGETLGELIGDEYLNSEEMVSKNAEQMKEVIWSVKKTFVEIGLPIDFHPGNIVKEEKTNRLVIIDTGMPMEEYEIITSDEEDHRTQNIFERTYQIINRISRYEEYLNLTKDQKKELNSKYEITQEEFNKRVKEIDALKDKKGINIDPNKDRLDLAIDDMFGERNEMTGQEVIDYAQKVLGKRKPRKGQQILIEKLKKDPRISGDKSFWKEIISPHT